MDDLAELIGNKGTIEQYQQIPVRVGAIIVSCPGAIEPDLAVWNHCLAGEVSQCVYVESIIHILLFLFVAKI